MNSCGAASTATATSVTTKAAATNVGCGAAQPAHSRGNRMRLNTTSIDGLRKLLAYDADTGALVWLPRPGNPRNDRTGKPAGHTKKDGYTLVSVNRQLFLKHRLCWALFYGEWPSTYIDHKDGNPDNNSISNLRLATPAQNSQNTRHYVRNQSGAKGVYLHKSGKYEAYITKDRKRHYLGLFSDFAGAVAARAKAQSELFTHVRSYVGA